MGAHGVAEHRAAHRHAERLENLFVDHGAIGCVLQLRQRVAEESETQIGVFVSSARIARQLVFCEKCLQLRRVVVGVGIGRVFRHDVGRHPRQGGVLGAEFLERNLHTTA
jgi:hypothetical protein